MSDFKDFVYGLYRQAGYPPLREIARWIQDDDALSAAPSGAAVGRCLGSPQLPAWRADAEAIASALASMAGRDGAAAAQRAGRLWAEATHAPAAGVPVRKLTDPFAFGVRPPIVLDTVALPELPAYVHRDHDQRLGEVLREAGDGHSALALVHGRRAAGQTRACWEAVASLPDGWRLLQPSGSDASGVLDALASAGPQTVVWLDRFERLLGGDAAVSQRLCAEINAVLRNGDRAPVLILATLGPRRGLFDPVGDEPHPLDPARALIEQHGIHVPSRFTEQELKELRCHAATDRRIALAAEFSRGRVTQYLTGDPRAHPVVRTRTFDQAIQAGDASTLHVGGVILQGQGRTEEAFTWYRQAAEQGDPHSMQIAADLISSAGMPEEAITWLRARADAGDAEAAMQMARQLRLAGDDSSAARWYQRAAELGAGAGAVHYAAQLLHRCGRSGEAMDWLTRLSDDGDLEARCAAAELLWKTGRTGRALESYRRAAADGHNTALQMAADRLWHANRLDEALALYQEAARAGNTAVLPRIVELLELWTREEALGWYLEVANLRRSTAAMRLFAMKRAAGLLAAAGDLDSALHWREQAAACQDTESMRAIAAIHRSRNDIETALAWYTRAANQGDPYAAEEASWMLSDIAPTRNEVAARPDTNSIPAPCNTISRSVPSPPPH